MSQQKTYDFPVFGTQGGGLVEEVAPNLYRFVEAPMRSTGLNVGDFMPKEWGTMPANDQAVRVMEEEEFGNYPDPDYFDVPEMCG